MLAAPSFLLSVLMLVGSVITLGVDGSNALPMAGAGLLFGTLSVFLVLSGGLAEMISFTGHSSVAKFPLLTASVITGKGEVRLQDIKTARNSK
jgi:hypothetical protein